MAETKTKPTEESVVKFLERIEDETRRQDCFTIAKLMEETTGSKPKLWGANIVGFGIRRVKYAGGREGDWPMIAFSPRKQNLTLYIAGSFNQHPDLMEKLGKHTLGGGCLYIKRLDDIHLPTLKKLLRESVKQAKKAS
jgi:hypothetical protein